MDSSSLDVMIAGLNSSSYCPCPDPLFDDEHVQRWLEETDEEADEDHVPSWKVWYTSLVLLGMFIGLVSERVGADSCMLTALTAYMTAGIITVPEGLIGFSNEGLTAVLALFIVAEGIGRTGALDWYMGKILGKPTNLALAQIRLMLPIAFCSAFLNNTPLVVVMIPIVQRWSQTIGINAQQLLIPLSFAAILGGSSSLIGAASNLVVKGLYEAQYPGQTIGIFDVGQFAVPVAIIGMTYVVLFSPCLLPGNKVEDDALFSGSVRGSQAGVSPLENTDELLLGARLTLWSPAAGRTVKSSGLRGEDGIYLINVYRGTTGTIHRAVGDDFILNVGDILYFTGSIEEFGEYCEEHGLEVYTNELETDKASTEPVRPRLSLSRQYVSRRAIAPTKRAGRSRRTVSSPPDLDKVFEEHHVAFADKLDLDVPFKIDEMPDIPFEIGVSRQSISVSSDTARMRSINAMRDLIRGQEFEPNQDNFLRKNDPSKIVVTTDSNNLVLIAINTNERPNLLLDISKTLVGLKLQVHHTEAKVVNTRALSIWRCEAVDQESKPKIEDIWSVLYALFEAKSGSEAVKKRGLKVVRARVTEVSSLIGKTAAQVDFRQTYKAAIIAVQKDGKQVKTIRLSKVALGAGDVLVLQASDTSPLLQTPPEGFYDNLSSETEGEGGEGGLDYQSAWRDLQVLLPDGAKTSQGEAAREFLTAMTVKNKASFVGKTAAKAGIASLPGVALVCIERPNTKEVEQDVTATTTTEGVRVETNVTEMSLDEPLAAGDILWYAGTATTVGDLRRIPGLTYYQSDEVDKVDEKVFDRRLVQAVVAQKGPLVGKTVKDAQFRTKYGAAVIGVHRDGKRIQEHPGKIKLVAGDVLLLEAGTTFVGKRGDHSFALIAEVKNSAPPRLSQLIPALLITVAMLLLYTFVIPSLTVCALLASILMVSLDILSEQEARDSVNWDIFIIIGSAFGIGKALVKSGISAAASNSLVTLGEALNMGDAGILGSVYLATFLVSNVVTNSAAAALLFPVALDVAETVGIDPIIMTYNLMIGASASFMSPFGYTTNLLIYGPGGYKTKDFIFIGSPMQIVLWIWTTLMLSFPELTVEWWLLSIFAFIVAVLSRSNIADLFKVPKRRKVTDVIFEGGKDAGDIEAKATLL